MKVIVTWGQDTPAYATEEVEVPNDASDEAIIAAVKEKADGVAISYSTHPLTGRGFELWISQKKMASASRKTLLSSPAGKISGL